jgi:peptide/nickel transport system substrate-binding protein
MNKTIIFFIGLLLVGGMLFAAGEQEAAAGESFSGPVSKIVIGTNREYIGQTYVGFNQGHLTWAVSQDPLFFTNLDGDYEPGLAESYEVSGDGLVWTFKLRDDVTWHDGRPFTAGDIVFSIQYQQTHSKNKSRYNSLVSAVAEDDTTLVTTIKAPDFYWFDTMANFYPLPEHIWSTVPDPYEFDDIEAASIGTGPYAFVAEDPDAGTLTWKGYEGYYKGAPAIEELVLRQYGTPDALAIALQTGEIDTMWNYARGMDYQFVPMLVANKNIDFMIQEPNGITNVLWMNTANPGTDDVAVRQAVAKAINYRELSNLMCGGYGAVGNLGFVPSVGYQYYKETPTLTRNLDEANRLLDDAGYMDVTGDGLREFPGGDEMVLRLVVRNDKSDYLRACERIVVYLAEAGLAVDLQPVDFKTWLSTADNRHAEQPKQFELTLIGTTYSGMTPNYGARYIGGALGIANYNDEEFQEIFAAMSTTFEPAERKKLIHAYQDNLAANVPALALYNMQVIQPYSNKYEGWAMSDPSWGIMCHDTYFNLRRVK